MSGILFFLASIISVFFMFYKRVEDENGNWVLSKQRFSVIAGTIATFIFLCIITFRSCQKL